MQSKSLPIVLPSRRDVLRSASFGFGWLALSALCQEETARAADAADPLAPKPPHVPGRAKQVIFIFLEGGPSPMDTFDYKPQLQEFNGKAPPQDQVYARSLSLLGSPFKFKQYGQSGLWVSELFDQLATAHADDLCFINSLNHGNNDHNTATIQMHTGEPRLVRPSLGSWVTYGLGAETKDLPAYAVISPILKYYKSYTSGFMPDVYSATPLQAVSGAAKGLPIPDAANPRLDLKQQRQMIDLLQSMNRDYAAARSDDSRLDAVIESFERGFAMQTSVPEVVDLSKEDAKTLDLYGLGPGGKGKEISSRLLLARRLVEKGVRFVEVNYGNWDHHQDLAAKLPTMTAPLDLALTGLVTDLKNRGMLKDTIIMIGGEFGRTAVAENVNGSKPDAARGRDHNGKGFTYVLIGGGAKGGFRYGETDDFGFAAVKDKASPFDLYATLLALLGLDPSRLTYRYAGRDYTLPDVHGQVIAPIVG